MPRRTVVLPPAVLPMAADTGRPIRWRLSQGLRAAILAGHFAAGSRLPSTRTLARALGVARSTVVEAVDQLVAEGFVECRRGSGTYVSDRVDTLRPATRTAAQNRGATTPAAAGGRSSTNRNGVAPPQPAGAAPFAPCEPDAALFPHALWARLLGRHTRGATHLSSDPRGHPEARHAIAAHLTLSRGMNVQPEDVFVVGGARQALDLAARCVLRPGEQVWMEEPGYPDARRVLTAASAECIPVPVDELGIDVTHGRLLAPRARAAYLTPSHQFPTGAVLALERRLQILNWATACQAWIFEDDYDSEFVYDRPLPALHALDPHRVLHMGTFNRIAFAGLRLGYLIVPQDLVDTVATMAAVMSIAPSTTVQAAFAEFIQDGHLNRHILRTRAAYHERQQHLIHTLHDRLAHALDPKPAPLGMTIIAHLRDPDADPEQIATRASGLGLDLRPLSRYTVGPPYHPALVLGYTHLDISQITAAVDRLATAMT